MYKPNTRVHNPESRNDDEAASRLAEFDAVMLKRAEDAVLKHHNYHYSEASASVLFAIINATAIPIIVVKYLRADSLDLTVILISRIVSLIIIPSTVMFGLSSNRRRLKFNQLKKIPDKLYDTKSLRYSIVFLLFFNAPLWYF